MRMDSKLKGTDYVHSYLILRESFINLEMLHRNQSFDQNNNENDLFSGIKKNTNKIF